MYYIFVVGMVNILEKELIFGKNVKRFFFLEFENVIN